MTHDMTHGMTHDMNFQRKILIYLISDNNKDLKIKVLLIRKHLSDFLAIVVVVVP
jgi:hypothetical protein